MINIALPYLTIAFILLIFSFKFNNEPYLIAANFIYSILCLVVIGFSVFDIAMSWHSDMLAVEFAFLNRILKIDLSLFLFLLIFSKISPLYFLTKNGRTSKIYTVFILFSACIAILCNNLYPNKILGAWHTMVIPIFNPIYIFCTTILLTIGSILMVKFRALGN